MAEATVSRGSTSVTFSIYQEAGELAIARDIGKPQQSFKTVSQEAPRSQDQLSGIDQLTVLGVFLGDGAYSRADTLVEDLVKPYSEGEPLQLDLTDVTGWDGILQIGVPDDTAVQLDYLPGRKDRVDIQLSVPVVSSTVG